MWEKPKTRNRQNFPLTLIAAIAHVNGLLSIIKKNSFDTKIPHNLFCFLESTWIRQLGQDPGPNLEEKAWKVWRVVISVPDNTGDAV